MKTFQTINCLLLLVAGELSGCAQSATPPPTAGPSARSTADASTFPTLTVPNSEEVVVVDGKLDEAFFREHLPVTAFVVAGDPQGKAPATKAWIRWSENRLVWAFACDDPTPAVAEPTDQEKQVDPQDRVELFLWSGKTDGPYYCIEIAAQGAVHDYKARFYRRFDDSWAPRDLQSCVLPTATGYIVEASLSKEDLARMGFALQAGETWRAGLFRADFDRLGGTPTWITWVDAQTQEPDFHVAAAFGSFRLADK
ncbi:MAG: sugar-binding protein [Pirellulaceae bacterium]